MDPWSTVTSKVAFLVREDVDTDTIIPQVELITTGRTGLGGGLFANWRYDGGRDERPEFVLNQRPYRTARVLAAGRNFGCGSSREHAAWALADFGIQCVLAPSYGQIFYRNCLHSRIAPLVVDPEALTEIQTVLGPACDARDLTVDLRAGLLSAGAGSWPVQVDRAIFDYVVTGLDDVGLTLRSGDEISRYEHEHTVPAVSVG
jgi:3-isopropylmalate/(R)-2-methylmalate dehydratase small subunit